MAKNNRTTSTPRRATAAKATPNPKEIICRRADDERGCTVSAPTITTADSNGIEVYGYRVEELAGLVRMCGESIYKELVSIGRSHPEALVQHSQSVTDYIDTLADILCETAAQIRGDAETLGGCPVPHVTAAKRFPSETQWREYQAATTAINARDTDDKDLEAAFREAQERFVYAEDATLQGIYLKLRLLAETESLSSNLEEGPHLLWPRIILTILRDLKALGSLQEATGAY
jgi:hypothetical protein